MGKELTDVLRTLPKPFLPQHIAAMSGAVGTVQHEGQATRYHLPRGWTLDESQRVEAKNLLSTFNSILNPGATFNGQPAADARDALVTALLMGLAVGQGSEVAADARLDLFEMALDDMPAWSVAEAIRRWARRECPPEIDKKPNYSFPPAPGVLRALAEREVAPYQRSVEDLNKLLAAETIEEAMDPAPRRKPAIAQSTAPRLRSM